MTLRDKTRTLLDTLGVTAEQVIGGDLPVISPINGEQIAEVRTSSPEAVTRAIAQAQKAFLQWRLVPPPQRGAFVRCLGEELREHRAALADIVTLEAGKISSEGLGEVQEMIDICDFAVGLSRQLYGLTIASERPEHRMMETWHPLGITAVISAFNFPVAVWSWNAALALVCGNSVLWKPSEKTPLTALACEAIWKRAAARCETPVPDDLLGLTIGGPAAAQALVDHRDIPLVSATGSTRMGREVAPRLAGRFARSILELGGNNAAIVGPSADVDLAVSAIAFSAMGTAGQRCTTLRRLFVHEAIYDELIGPLKHAYGAVAIGDPFDPATLVGPLIDADAHARMESAIDAARQDGGLCTGGERVARENGDGIYVRPALVEMPRQSAIMLEETFAPILYVMRYETLSEAIRLLRESAAGLSSSIFTKDLREAETFLGAAGSDCGIANVNIGTSGAEVGGAFGGEKDTGGGRESGSDAWKAYMRRATNTINYSQSSDVPLAQSVSFRIGEQ